MRIYAHTCALNAHYAAICCKAWLEANSRAINENTVLTRVFSIFILLSTHHHLQRRRYNFSTHTCGFRIIKTNPPTNPQKKPVMLDRPIKLDTWFVPQSPRHNSDGASTPPCVTCTYLLLKWGSRPT